MTLIGYARVSTADQNLDQQREALTRAGCDRIYEEKASGAKTDRPELDAALATLEPGDTLVVYRLDRLGRSVRHLLDVATALREAGVQFRSLTEGFDTSTPVGQCFYTVVGAFAQLERDLIAERTREHLASARARGVQLGRRRAVTADKLRLARLLMAEGANAGAAAETVGVGRSTLYRALGS